MIIIQASCPCCGDVELVPNQVRLVICSVEERSFYSFRCEQCYYEVKKHANEDVVALLRTGGVLPERWVIPAEALEHHNGSPLTPDDLLDFCISLEMVEKVAAVAQLYE